MSLYSGPGFGNVKNENMNRRLKKQLFFLLFSVLATTGYPQTDTTGSRLYLFADRDYCVSGDTVWFKVAVKNEEKQKSNIVHVQLTNAENRLISEVIKKSENGWAEGFLYVPDSLSSGVCFLSAFLYEHSTIPGFTLVKKTVFVYNRFHKGLTEQEVPSEAQKVQTIDLPVSVRPDKKVYRPREKVSVILGLEAIDAAEVSHVVARVHLRDEIAAKAGGHFYTEIVPLKTAVRGFKEKDGFIVSGKVTDRATGTAGENVVVLLSLINDPQYLDYCVSDSEGSFQFFLKNAVGEGEIVLQAVARHENEWNVEPGNNQLNVKAPVILKKRQLTKQQSQFIDEIIDGAFFEKLFAESYSVKSLEFSMPRRFEMPVYGYPYKRVVPGEFFDLQDFRQISRELLPGVQYRVRDDKTTLRLVDINNKVYLKNEPFILVNGIPVFNNRHLSPLGSTDIDHIEYVLEDRLFGDLRFNGVLAVYLKDESNTWLSRHPRFSRFSIPFLQPGRNPSGLKRKSEAGNLPDLRTVYFWQLMQPGEPKQIEFFLSDRKGLVEISVEGVTKNGEVFKISETIEVK